MAQSWYYAAGGKQTGPITEEELDSLVSSGVIRGETLVWHEGLTEWQPFRTVRPDVPLPPPLGDAAARFCSECGQPRLERELAAFGDRLVCYSCKDAFAQRLREQGAPSKSREYAGFWIRFLAKLLDGIVLYIVILPISFLILGSAAFTASEEIPSGAYVLLNIIALLFQLSASAAYEVWFLVKKGATPGKMVIGARVITADGRGLSVGRAVGRHFAVYLSSLTFFVGFIMAAFDEQKRALHDRICDTRVVTK
jgi:uncharacterized RDD family membrane protein YckC